VSCGFPSYIGFTLEWFVNTKSSSRDGHGNIHPLLHKSISSALPCELGSSTITLDVPMSGNPNEVYIVLLCYLMQRSATVVYCVGVKQNGRNGFQRRLAIRINTDCPSVRNKPRF